MVTPTTQSTGFRVHRAGPCVCVWFIVLSYFRGILFLFISWNKQNKTKQKEKEKEKHYKNFHGVFSE